MIILVNSCYKGLKISQTENIKIAGEIFNDTSFVSKYRQSIDSAFTRKIGHSFLKLEKNKPNGTLGYLMSMACFDVGLNFCNENQRIFTFLNNGGIRGILPEGEITLKNVFEVMPFDNKIVILELNGIQMDELFKHISIKGGCPIFNLELEIDGKGVYKNPKISKHNFDSRKNYWVITSDYLANGNDDCVFLKNSIQIINTNVLIRDALSDFIFKNQPITKEFFEEYQLIKNNE